jgi:transcriptional regulator with XRE-family HTH domain
MPTRETPSTRGLRRGRWLAARIAGDLGDARRNANLSLREVGRRVGVGHEFIARIDRGEARAMRIDLVARYAAVVGLELSAALFPRGDPVRDEGHLDLISRFRARLHRSLRWEAEVPVPLPGDPRSGDGMIGGNGWDALVEAETRIGDIQLIERRSAAKQRDLGARRLILLVADTRHNREVLRRHPELRERFPIGTRRCLARLGQALDPGGDALVIL